MATLLLKSAWPKFSDFLKKWHFCRSNRIHIEFLVQIQDQRPKIDPCIKFWPNWTKDKESRISTSNDSENCLMTSYIPDSADVIKPFNEFERFFCQSAIMPSLVMFGRQINEKHRSPLHLIFYQNSPASTGLNKRKFRSGGKCCLLENGPNIGSIQI